jgi:hypothetical protein
VTATWPAWGLKQPASSSLIKRLIRERVPNKSRHTEEQSVTQSFTQSFLYKVSARQGRQGGEQINQGRRCTRYYSVDLIQDGIIDIIQAPRNTVIWRSEGMRIEIALGNDDSVQSSPSQSFIGHEKMD